MIAYHKASGSVEMMKNYLWYDFYSGEINLVELKDFLLKIYNLLYDEYGSQGWWPAEDWFEVIVGAILTQNTSWKNVERAISNLRNNRVLKPEKLYALPLEQLAALIKPAGFYNLKAQRLKNMLKFLKQYDFDFMKLSSNITREVLLEIKGVGKETADSILLYAFNVPVFVVDNYTKRIFQRLGVLSNKDDYDSIQKLFYIIPPDLQMYKEYHALIVKHAKNMCTKHKPSCDQCALENFCKYLSRF